MRITQALCMSFFIFLSSFCLANQAFGCNPAEMTEKIYVSRDQILLTESEIFVAVGDILLPVNQINCDSGGIYITPYMAWTKQKCPEGHNIRCRRCYGCDWRRCKYACKCR